MIFDVLNQGLFSRSIGKKILSHFGGNAGHNLNEHQGELGYGLIHYALIANCRPERVLCIGSMKGFIPAICALACKDNQRGHVDFVDAGLGREDPNHWGGVGFWKRVNPTQHFSLLGISSWLTTHVMTSEEFVRHRNGPWDYMYIDADHSYEGVKRDYRLYWPRLSRGGFMTFHDVLLKEHPEHANFGVWRFWQELPDAHKITIPFTRSTVLPSGLGVIQKL